ncbi:MAG: hypothetical protein KDE46_30235, partial [Caldilineaceae bacterium]|nr:hypothetical protein [Caldilineaceae bacterium]
MLKLTNCRMVYWVLNILVLCLSLLPGQTATAQAPGPIYMPLVITSGGEFRTNAEDATSVNVAALPQPTLGMWISADELAALPAAGAAWAFLKSSADQPL